MIIKAGNDRLTYKLLFPIIAMHIPKIITAAFTRKKSFQEMGIPVNILTHFSQLKKYSSNI
jgi:uncharacterized membrane protein